MRKIAPIAAAAAVMFTANAAGAQDADAMAPIARLMAAFNAGDAAVEPAVMTFALRRGANGWRISGWTWGGTEPGPAQAGS